MAITALDIIGALATAGAGGGIKWAVDRYLAARKEAREARSADKAKDAEAKAAASKEAREAKAAERAAELEREKVARAEDLARERSAVEALANTATELRRLTSAIEKMTDAAVRTDQSLTAITTSVQRIDARTESDDREFTAYRTGTVAHREAQGALLAEARSQLAMIATALARVEARLDVTGEHRAAVVSSAAQGETRG